MNKKRTVQALSTWSAPGCGAYRNACSRSRSQSQTRMHCLGGAKLKSICRTVQVLPECLRLRKVPAVHCNIAKTKVSLGSRMQTTLPTSGPTDEPLIRKLTIHVCRLCCSPAESATDSHQCNSLQCSQVHGSGQLQTTPLIV